MDITNAASSYTGRGWRIAPALIERSANGKKRPSYIYTGGQSVQQSGTNDPSTAFSLVDGIHDDAGLVIQTGSVSGLAVLDVDNLSQWDTLLDDFDRDEKGTGASIVREVPDTFTVKSQSGGLHLYFKMPEALRGHSAITFVRPALDTERPGDTKPHGIDMLLEGRIVFAAPSPVWAIDRQPGDGPVGEYTVTSDVEPAEMPAWMIEWYLKEHASRAYKHRATSNVGLAPAAIPAAWKGIKADVRASQRDRLLGWVKEALGSIDGEDLWDNSVARVCGILVRAVNSPLGITSDDGLAFLEKYAPRDSNPDWDKAIPRIYASITRTVGGEGFPPDTDDSVLSYLLNAAEANAREFWHSTPQLRHVHTVARARGINPDGVLATVLQECTLRVPWNVRFKSALGTAPVNTAMLLTARSGGGKGITMRTAREAFTYSRGPEVIPTKPASGQAIADALLSWKPGKAENKRTGQEEEPGRLEWNDEHHAALYEWTEITEFNSLVEQSGSTIMPSILAAWSGESLSRTRANSHRIEVPENEYRAAVRIHAQPSLARPLFTEDAIDAGLVSRFLFVSARGRRADKSLVPGDPMLIEIPEMMDHFEALPVMEAAIDAFKERQDDDEEISPWDTHSLLNRCKWAVAFAVLHGRSYISEHDWECSGYLMQRSNEVRYETYEEIRGLQSRKSDSAAQQEGKRRVLAESAESAERKRILTASVERHLSAGFTHNGTATGGKGTVRNKIAVEQRPLYDEVFAEAKAAEAATYKAAAA